jgi:hypothetical protein
VCRRPRARGDRSPRRSGPACSSSSHRVGADLRCSCPMGTQLLPATRRDTHIVPSAECPVRPG